MMKNKLLKLAMWQGIIAAVIFVVNYFFYHFVTDYGISLVWQPEPGKPFVSDLIGQLGVLFVFSALISLLCALIFFEKNEGEEK